MALPSHRSHGLLWTILRSRSSMQIQHPFHAQMHRRTPNSTSQSTKNAYSVSFGPETDKMIATYKDPSKQYPRSTGRARSARPRDQSSNKVATSTGSIEITLSDEDGDILATRKSQNVQSNFDHRGPQQLYQQHVASHQDRLNTPSRSKRDRDSTRSRTIDKPETETSTSPQVRNPITKKEPWQVQKDALGRKFGLDNWSPRKKLSPDAIQGLRDLHAEDPERYSTPVLADRFKVSPEAIRRILKGKWRATPEEMEDRRQRWARRHDRIWDHKSALGQRPRRQRDKIAEGPEAFEEELRAKQMLGQI